jgi:hypothetical protein
MNRQSALFVVGLAWLAVSATGANAGEVSGKQNINVKGVVQSQGGYKTKQEVEIGNVTGQGKVSGDQNINVGAVIQSQGGYKTTQKTKIGNVE